MPDLRQPIQSALQAFTSQPLRKAALFLLDTLGYRSDRTLVLEGSKPQAFLELVQSQATPLKFDPEKALFSDWKSADILFQLTDDDLAATSSLFKETDIKSGLLRSYLFFAIELKGTDYARGKLSAIARQINRVAAYEPEASAAQQRDFLTQLHATLNVCGHPIRNRLLRLTADSPDLLAIIKQKGKV